MPLPVSPRFLVIALLAGLSAWTAGASSDAEVATDAGPSSDAEELRRIHDALLAAHREGDVEAWMALEASDYVSVNGGRVSFPTLAERRDRRAAYLEDAEFRVYRDLRKPTVKVSEDGTLGWLVAEVEAAGTVTGDEGAREPFHDVWAWVELYEKADGGWRMVGNASNHRPGSDAEVTPSPEPRGHHQLVRHGTGDRVYLLGGSTPRDEGHHYFDDLWSWDGTQWRSEGTLPFPRSSHRIVYHEGRRSLLLFGGGASGDFASDDTLWEWRGDQWTALAVAPGAGRAEPGLCYDRRRERVVVFGGWDDDGEFSGLTWEWDGRSLAVVDSTGPSPRSGHVMVYDPLRESCLLFGGGNGEQLFDQTWERTDEGWQRLAVAGPPARWFAGAATDDANDRVVLFGGSGDEENFGDTWIWDGERWELLTREGPPARGMPRLAFDGEGVVLFGGRERTEQGHRDLGDTWVLRGETWEKRGP